MMIRIVARAAKVAWSAGIGRTRRGTRRVVGHLDVPVVEPIDRRSGERYPAGATSSRTAMPRSASDTAG